MIHNNKAGFTLIEVLIAMAILAVGLLGLGMMQAYFAEGNANSRQIIHATDVGTNKIEELSSITDPGHADLNPAANPHSESVNDYPLDYTVSWDVTDNGDNTLDIDLTVSWDQGGQNHSINFRWIKGL